jgi:RNA polymerase-binding protein DksA
MTKKELSHFQKELINLGKRLKGHVSNLQDAALRQTGGEASGNLSNAPMHLADLGSDTFEQELSLSLLENEDQQLQEVSNALARLEAGSYGRCEECGKTIALARLSAMPWARQCIECARAEQAAMANGNL